MSRYVLTNAVVSDSTGSQQKRQRVRRVELDDAEMTSIRISSLLPQQSYRVAVAAKTRAGVGVSATITASTGSFNERTFIYKLLQYS